MVDKLDTDQYTICRAREHEVDVNVTPKPRTAVCKHCSIRLIWQPPIEGYWYSIVNGGSTAEMTKREKVRENSTPEYRPV